MGYSQITAIVGKEMEFTACDLCGCLVYDLEKHDIDHEARARVADSAMRADMFTRPLGGIAPTSEYIEPEM